MSITRRIIATIAIIVSIGCTSQAPTSGSLFLWGSDINLKFTRYVAELTQKQNPHILYLPTASGDNQDNIQFWESICKALGLESHIMRVWVDSWAEQTFEQMIEKADAIIIGGGNTLNMLGIWQAQGIDQLLIEAMQRGTIVAGGSAGSIAWFDSGISDSRPEGLSVVEGLGVLPFSNCPHYGDQAKRSLYHQMLEQGKIEGGYAMDDKAGVLFRDGQVIEAVTYSPEHKAYYVESKGGKATATELPTRLLLDDGAIAEQEYTIEPIHSSVKELSDRDDAIGAYIGLMGRHLSPDTRIEMTLTHNDLTAVVHNAYIDLLGGYGIYFLYNDGEKWQSMGEDLGSTIAESEITFREKAAIILQQAKEKYNN